LIDVRKTAEFAAWIESFDDEKTVGRIAARIDRLALGNPGEWKSLGGGLNEMKLDFGPGYRLYYTYRGKQLVILLCGGDRGSQKRDIKRARQIMES
jgi:putative addiction module killer protein